MKTPRGHSSMDGCLGLLFLLFGIPALCVLSLVALAVGKIWFHYSWAWLGLPVVALAVWYAVITWMGQR